MYAPSHRQVSTYHGLCYTSLGALAGTRNSTMGPPWRIDPTTHRTMSERSYHEATSHSCYRKEKTLWDSVNWLWVCLLVCLFVCFSRFITFNYFVCVNLLTLYLFTLTFTFLTRFLLFGLCFIFYTFIYHHTHTHTHTYIHTYMCACVYIWLAWLTSNCGRIGAIGSSPSNGLRPNMWGQKGFNPLCQCVYIYVCIVKPDIQ